MLVQRSASTSSNQNSNVINSYDPPIYSVLDHKSYINNNPNVGSESFKNECKPNDLPSYEQVVFSFKDKNAQFKPAK